MFSILEIVVLYAIKVKQFLRLKKIEGDNGTENRYVMFLDTLLLLDCACSKHNFINR